MPKRKVTTNAKILAFTLLVAGGLVLIQMTPPPVKPATVDANDVAAAQEAEHEAEDRAARLEEVAAANEQASRHDKQDATQLSAEARTDLTDASLVLQDGQAQAKAEDAEAIGEDGAGIRE